MTLRALSRPYSGRLAPLGAAAMVIASGLALRGYGYALGLPFIVVKYGGSLLWGAMVYLLLAAILPPRPKSLAVLLATVLAVAVELLRLYHAPWLDDFRATAAGALLLGRVFSLWNILAYLVGIVAAWCCHRTGDIRP